MRMKTVKRWIAVLLVAVMTIAIPFPNMMTTASAAQSEDTWMKAATDVIYNAPDYFGEIIGSPGAGFQLIDLTGDGAPEILSMVYGGSGGFTYYDRSFVYWNGSGYERGTFDGKITNAGDKLLAYKNENTGTIEFFIGVLPSIAFSAFSRDGYQDYLIGHHAIKLLQILCSNGSISVEEIDSRPEWSTIRYGSSSDSEKKSAWKTLIQREQAFEDAHTLSHAVRNLFTDTFTAPNVTGGDYHDVMSRSKAESIVKNYIKSGFLNGYYVSTKPFDLDQKNRFKYSQEHTVADYYSQNLDNADIYYSGCARALDGNQYNPDMIIPGLIKKENMVPQGIVYYPDKNWMLVSAYFNNDRVDSVAGQGVSATNASVIYALNCDTGRMEALFQVYNNEKNPNDSHVSGVAVSKYNLYIITGNQSISYVPLTELNVEPGTTKKIVPAGTASIKGLTPANASYLFCDGGFLLTGNFYAEGKKEKDKGYETKANSSSHTALYSFKLGGESSAGEWRSLQENGLFRSTATVYNIPDSIKHVQGVAYAGGYIFLSSSYGRQNDGVLYYAPISQAQRESAYRSVKALPMQENLTVKDGYLYTLSESAAWTYNGEKPKNRSKNPTDVIWQIDYNVMLDRDPIALTKDDVQGLNVRFLTDYYGDVSIDFKQSWFSLDSAVYNHQLASFCSKIDMLGYLKKDKGKKSEMQMEEIMSKLGFSNSWIDLHTGRDEVNYVISSRDITVNGERKKLILAAFIGSHDLQWNSNFDPYGKERDTKADRDAPYGSEKEKSITHLGFLDAKEFVAYKLDSYIDERIDAEPSLRASDFKLLVTGHSRGAATANLLGAALIKGSVGESGSGRYPAAKDIYVYTFATPNVTKKIEIHESKYHRIFNIVNPEDFVTKVLPNERWGYGRYGTTFVLPSKTNAKDYKRYRDNMQQYFNQYYAGTYSNYWNGEKAVYLIIQNLVSAVDCESDLDAFYEKDIMMVDNQGFSSYEKPFDFFKNGLCPLVNNTGKTAEAIAYDLSILAKDYLTNSVYSKVIRYFLRYEAIGTLTKEVDINKCFSDAHLMQTYCSYMSSLSEFELTRPRKGYQNTVNCPVDVEIYDNETGELVGRIRNNRVDEEVASKDTSVVMDVDGDEKSFWLPGDGDYNVVLTGNDEGTMDYTVFSIDENGLELDRKNYLDISVSPGKAYTSTYAEDAVSAEEVAMQDEQNRVVDAQSVIDEDHIQMYTVTSIADGDGTVSGEITVSDGGFVSVAAAPNEGSEFSGWYRDDALVSRDHVYRFRPENNVELIAKFQDASADPTIVEKGKCGYNVNYTLYTDGKLIISGSGPMYNYECDPQLGAMSPFLETDFTTRIRIKSVEIRSGVTSIGDYVFYGCTSLTNVTIPDSVTRFGDYAFIGCTGLTSVTIPDGVTTIGNMAFTGCSGLTSVKIPAGVSSIGSAPFAGCHGLESIQVSEGNAVYRSSNNCLIETAKKKLVSGCKASVIPSDGSVTTIGSGAFSDCSGLAGVKIPDSVTSVDELAFYNCSGLTVVPDSITSVGCDAFYGTDWYESQPDGLVYAGKVAYKYKGDMPDGTSFALKPGTTEIADDAFYNCTGLKSVTIPDSVTSIGEAAFDGCTGLTSMTIPDSVTSIDRFAFDGCSGLTSVKIGKGVTSIGWSAFDGCTGLTSVTIPDSVTSIDKYAFRGCSGLTSMTIPDSVTSIGEYAFSRCEGLTSVKIGKGVTSIGDEAFSDTAWFEAQPDGLVYAGKVAYKYKGKMPAGTRIVLRDGTTGIAGGAFSGCTGLTNVTIPNSVRSFGDCAFASCSGLTSVSIPDGVTSINSGVFINCTGLTSVTIPASVTSIGFSAFSGCTGLTSVTIPVGVTSIDEYAFSGCTGLTSVTIPDSVISIGSGAFEMCEGLTDIYYGGTKAQWNKLTGDLGATENTTIHFGKIDPPLSETPGDANGDGKIDSKDILRLCNYLQEFDYDTNTSSVSINAKAADCNGDGKIDSKDILRLCNYLQEFDYDTGTSPVKLGK